ncbi:methionyl-tRNA formyltransferase [Leptothoe sp. LEGE 181152]|uniref:Methionyl-tRNA formyltransferase n=1 Tax=Adonisia turfae CCMR0081 TaxID=2292702 RepID=A0A6M0RPA3_9CYAN|nr:methionyl-tRNA formyltransferase [Adonisia turfae]MDV3353829.1 methionyl-tRNA formyltransferase [Leptothoe sp. LEGE 181152]NEZ58006.1 methionyl-tRNA formyltransferase [Adonisia turfae CCMR0081]
MKVVYFGTPQFAVPGLIRLLKDPDFDIIAVVTQPDKRRGRGSKVTPSPVKTVATEAGIPVWQPQKIKKDAEALDFLSHCQADAFVVVAYGQILSQEILDMPRLGSINGHGSILPTYRGAAPIQWSLYHGEAETGVTTMLMDAGMDTGPMLLEEKIPIGLLDNAWAIADTLSKLTAELLLSTLHKLDGQAIRPIPQIEEQATYAPLIKKADYVIDWQRPALDIHNQIRGFYPNCVTQLQQPPLKISETIPLFDGVWSQLPEDYRTLKDAYGALKPAEPGKVMAVWKNHGPVIGTGDGYLLLRQVQPAGKKSQSGWAFANGSRLALGENLG